MVFKSFSSKKKSKDDRILFWCFLEFQQPTNFFKNLKFIKSNSNQPAGAAPGSSSNGPRIKSVVFRHDQIDYGNQRSSGTTTNGGLQETRPGVGTRPKSNYHAPKAKTLRQSANSSSLPGSATSNVANRIGFAPKRLNVISRVDYDDLLDLNDMLDQASTSGATVTNQNLKSDSGSSLSMRNAAQPSVVQLVKPSSSSTLTSTRGGARMNRKVVDLIRVDGKRYSAPEASVLTASKFYPRSTSVSELILLRL